jgi:hypothetical protein
MLLYSPVGAKRKDGAMNRPRLSAVAPQPAAAAGRAGGWRRAVLAGVRRLLAGLWRRGAVKLPEMSDHLRRDIGLPALAYRGGFSGRILERIDRPRPPV